MARRAVESDRVIENIRLYSSDSETTGTGLWGLLDATLSEAHRTAQAFKNDHPDKEVWMKADGKTYRINKITAGVSNFEDIIVRQAPAVQMQRKAPAIKRMAK